MRCKALRARRESRVTCITLCADARSTLVSPVIHVIHPDMKGGGDRRWGGEGGESRGAKQGWCGGLRLNAWWFETGALQRLELAAALLKPPPPSLSTCHSLQGGGLEKYY